MTYIIIILSLIITILIPIGIFLIWYLIEAVRQIRNSEQYIHNLIEGIEELKESMQKYVGHVVVVNEMEMFYGDETLRELIRHGTALVETFEEYKIDYFPILHIEEITDYDNKNESDQNPEN